MSDKTQCHVCKGFTVNKRLMFNECGHMYCIQCLYRLIFVNHIEDIKNCEFVRIRCKSCDNNGYLDMTLNQIHEFLREKINDDRRGKQNCDIHSDEELSFFCKTCQMNICKECRMEEHREHVTIECAVYAKKYRQYLSNLPLKYSTLEQFVASFDKTANNFKNEIEANFIGTIIDIDELIKDLIRLKKEYAQIIKKRLEKGLLLLKIIKIFYCNFYLDLQKKDTCTDIFLLKYLKDINFEFDELTLSHNKDILNEINFIKNESYMLRNSKEGILDISCSYTEIPRKFQNEGKLSKHKKAITSIIQLKDKRLLTGSRDYTIRFWEERDGTFINTETIDEFTGSVQCLFQCEDGQILSSCQDNNTIRIWNKKEGKYTCELTLSEHKDYVTSIMQLSDGKLVTASKDKTICIWEQNNRLFQKQHTLVEHDDAVYSVVEISGGRIASASDDNTIRIWEEIDSKFKCIQILQGHKKGVRTLCSLRDGRLASGSEDQTFKIWKYEKEKWECVFTMLGHHFGITCIIQLNDGRLVTTSKDKTVRVWTTVSKGFIKKEVLRDHQGEVFSVIELPDGRLASASRDCQVIIWKGGNMVE